jgi:formate hydrogenlyase subunit 6/NADH:ubiquinone oxidoreductase subunit I
MKLTGRIFFTKPTTIQYPEEEPYFSPHERGLHEFEPDKCIACFLCAKACPVDCITIEGPRLGVTKYEIDYAKCLFCALCTEPCPTDCIHMGKLHDLSGYSREDVVVEFADLDKRNLRTPIPIWMERNEERIPWVKEEYERVKAGKLATTAADIPEVK